MKTIWKIPLLVMRYQVASLPAGAQPLSIQMQRGVPCLWVLVDTNRPMVASDIYTFGTGHEMMHADFDVSNYIGTYQLADGTVWHVFGSLT